MGFDDLIALAQHYGGSAADLEVVGNSDAFAIDRALAPSLVPEPGRIVLRFAAGTMRRRR